MKETNVIEEQVKSAARGLVETIERGRWTQEGDGEDAPAPARQPGLGQRARTWLGERTSAEIEVSEQAGATLLQLPPDSTCTVRTPAGTEHTASLCLLGSAFERSTPKGLRRTSAVGATRTVIGTERERNLQSGKEGAVVLTAWTRRARRSRPPRLETERR